jgi:ferredoxin
LVEKGEDNLSEADDDEMDAVERVPTTKPNSRLACLAVVQGDVTVRVPG